jgi:hypothetical protein
MKDTEYIQGLKKAIEVIQENLLVDEEDEQYSAVELSAIRRSASNMIACITDEIIMNGGAV